MTTEEKYYALKAKLAKGETLSVDEKVDLMRSILQTCYGVWRMEMGPQLREIILFTVDVTKPSPSS